jgi:hypothetical protein
MAKYVKCVNSSGWSGDLSRASCYKIIHSDGLNYLIKSDSGKNIWFECERFEEPYEIPDMIIFSSQQEFEDAVMKVILERLDVVYAEKITPYGNTKADLKLEDNH